MTQETDSKELHRMPQQALWLVVTRGISGLGSSLTSFGLNVWVFKQTGSYSAFVYLALITMLPNLLLAPFAGLLTDRCDKRKLLLACELAPALALVGALWQVQHDSLSVLSIVAINLVISIAGTVRWMVMGVTISILAPASARNRLNGLQQSISGVSTVLGPTLGAVGLEMIGVAGLLAFDLAATLGAAITLLTIRAPGLKNRDTSQLEFGGFWREVTFGLRWISKHPGLMRLMLFFTFLNLGVSVYGVVFTPYVLAFGASQLLGWGLTGQGAGAFLCGAVLARWKGKTYPELNVLWGSSAFGAMMMVWGVSKSAYAIVLLAFCAGALTSLIMTSSQTIWQANVPVEIQGKVFSARMMVSFSLRPIAVVASMPASMYVFTPILENISWTRKLWGDLPGGSIGMMVSALGAAMVIGSVVLATRGGLAIKDSPGARQLELPA